MNKRLHTLDYLRGFAALSILVFHFYLFNGLEMGVSSFIQRMGFYGVSIFYVLSGLTLYLIYANKDFSEKEVVYDFFKKRIYRIFPLFIVLTSFVYFFLSKETNVVKYLLNITGLFAIFDYSGYIITGGWSIGNELIFYLCLPLIFFLKKDNILYLAVFLSFIAYCYFSYFMIDVSADLSLNWKNYIHPCNQGFLFLGGMLLARLFLNKDMPLSLCSLLILFSFSIFIFYNISDGGVISLVYGNERLIFTVASMMAVLGFFKMGNVLPTVIDKILYKLGEISYGIYLIHPMIIKLINKYFFFLGNVTKLLMVMLITILLSLFSFQYFEKFFMNLARKKA